MKDDNSACSHSIHLNGHHLDNKNAGEVHSIVYVLLRVRRRVLHNFLIAIFSALITVSILLCSDTFLGTPTPITAPDCSSRRVTKSYLDSSRKVLIQRMTRHLILFGPHFTRANDVDENEFRAVG